VFVALDRATRPEQVLAGIARAVEADLTGTDSAPQALVEQLSGGRWLLILDNLEQVLEVAGDLGELMARCPGMAILATSRTVLGLRAEREYPVPPLVLAADATVSVETMMASPAVALFVDRARAVRPDFELTTGNAGAVVEICRRLEGLPLAIELAAARTRMLDPAELLRRLATSLDALGTGAVDLPPRQRTLRDTAQWSVDLLDDEERSLLEIMAIFVDGWTVDAAAQVAGLTDDRALDLSEALARHSLIQLDSSELGPRLRMLNVIREFVAERLAARPDIAEIGRRHADYYRTLAERADRPLRGLDQDHWAGRLEVEADNLAAAVGWYLANGPGRLPNLFRILWLYWGLRDHLGEARAWIDQLLPIADSLAPQAQAELLWTAAVTDLEVVGDDEAALATRQRLGSLLAAIQDPYLHAVSQLAMAGISAVVGDFDGALRGEFIVLEELSGQDEPYWTTVAVLTTGLVETAMGNLDAALGHLREARAMAGRFDHAGLSAWSQVQLGILALVRGRPEEAKGLLDEGLELSLATHSTRNVTLCLTAFAQLAFVAGNGDRAALLAGRPRACANVSACGRGRSSGRGRPRSLPRSGRHWARTGSTRDSPTAAGSTAERRWPRSAKGRNSSSRRSMPAASCPRAHLERRRCRPRVRAPAPIGFRRVSDERPLWSSPRARGWDGAAAYQRTVAMLFRVVGSGGADASDTADRLEVRIYV
jgi:predicted ATPase